MEALIERIVAALRNDPELRHIDKIEGEPAVGVEHDGDLYFLTIERA